MSMNNSLRSLFIEFYCGKKQFMVMDLFYKSIIPRKKRSTLTVSRYGGNEFRLRELSLRR